jgi:hypothetical protein
MTSTTTLERLAAEAYSYFESFKRETSPDSPQWRLKKERPEWVYDLVYAAHGDGDFMPDDWRYDCIHSALEYLADEDNDPDDAHEFADGQVDVYTGARLHWLASNLQRPGYVDEAVGEFGATDSDSGEFDVAHAIGLGQYQEASEVFGLVVEALREREAELVDEDGDDA